MKKVTLLFCGIFLSFFSFSQTPDWLWAKGMGPGAGNSCSVYSIATDGSGNVYSTGFFQGTVDFDPGAGTFNLSASLEDIFISKYNSSGNFIWAKQIGGSYNKLGYAIALDASGNVYTTGYFRGTTDFDPGPGTYNLTATGVTSYDVFISKLDNSGNFVWAKQFIGAVAADQDFGYSLATDASGNVFTTGSFQGTLDFDPGAGTYNLTSAGGSDIFISKLNNSGNFVWAVALGAPTYYDEGRSVKIDGAGNVYITGNFTSTIDFDPGPGVFNLTSASAGSSDAFISKLDNSGNFIWAKRMGGTQGDIGFGMSLDALGNVFTSGYFTNTADFDPGAGVFNLTGGGTFISGLDASGNFIMAKRIAGVSSPENIYSLTNDATGNIYLLSQFEGTVDMDPGAGVYNLTAIAGSNSFASRDIFMVKLDNSGNFVWAKAMGGNDEDIGYAMAVSAAGNQYIGGAFGSSSIGFGATVLTNTGGSGWDMHIAKLDNPVSPPTASITAGGPTSFCIPGSVTLNANTGTGLSYQWRLNNSNISGATSSSYAATASGNYECLVTNATGSAISNSITVLALSSPPTATITAGGPTTFCSSGSVTLSANTGTGLTYQWRLNGVNISGATLSTRTVSASGNYDCVVTNSCGSSTSNTITVTVTPGPSITISAAGPTSICSPGSVTLNAIPSSGITYQWRLNGVDISGATLSSYVATASGVYNCVGNNGCSTTSNSITVTVSTSAPTSTITAGGPTTFCSSGSVTLSTNTGTGLTYQWRLNGVNISGATSSSHTVSASGNYDCVVTNSCGSTTSNTITVTVTPGPSITISAAGPTSICSPGSVTLNAIPSSGITYQWRLNSVDISGATSSSYVAAASGAYTCVGNNGCSTTSNSITVTVSGSLPTATIAAGGPTTFCEPGNVVLSVTTCTSCTYQWRLNGVNISGATGTTRTITASGNYDCVVTNGCGSAISNSITVMVNPLPVASITSSATAICSPQGYVELTANTGTGLTYQWQGNNVNISGATFSTYYAYSVGTYRCIVTNSCGSTTSNAISISTGILPTVSITAGGPTTFCHQYGSNPYDIGSVILTASATGSGLSYQWRNGGNIQGATSTSYTATTSGWYDCLVTNACGSVVSNTIVVSALPGPSTQIYPLGDTTCYPGNVFFSVGCCQASYQWWGPLWSNGPSFPITGQTSNWFYTNIPGNYYCVQFDGTCYSTTNPVTVVVNYPPAISITASGPTAFCNSVNPVTLNATPSSGLTYQWRQNSVDIPGATSSSYVATTAGNYSCVASDVTCSASSNNISVTVVTTPPTATLTANGPTTFCASSNVVLIVSTCATCTYQWRLNGVNISGATASTRTVSASGNYDCVVTNACGSTTSNSITVTVNPAPAITQHPNNGFVCAGNNISFNVSATGVGLTYQWQENSINIINGGVYSGATTSKLTLTGIPSNFDLRQYRCVVSGTCSPAATSNAAMLSVGSLTTPAVSITGPSTLCANASGTYQAFPQNAGLGPIYQWKINGVNAGTNSLTFFSGPLNNGDVITCTLTATDGCSTTPTAVSNPITVTITPLPTATITASGPTTFCSPGSVTLNANTGSGLTYQWRLSSVNISGATSSSYTATATGNYDCVVSNTCGGTVSNVITVSVLNQSTLSLQPNAAAGEDAILWSIPAQANSNFGTYPDVQSIAWTFFGTPGTRRTLIRFNLNSIPSSAIVQQAILSLYNNPSSGDGNPAGEHSNLSGSNISWLQKVTSPWSESTVTWNNQPSTATTNQVTVPQSTSTHQDYNIDVTALAQDMVANPASNYGFMLRLQTESYYRLLLFASSDCADSTKWPKISITYYTPLTASITAGGPTTFCSPGSVTLNANIGAGLTYQWRLNSAPIIGATLASYVATTTGNYDCILSNSCGSATSNTIAVTVNTLPPATIAAAGPVVFCDPGTVTLNASTGTGLTYQWRQNNVNIPGEILSSYIATASGNYGCIITNSCGSATSNIISVMTELLPSAAVTAGGPTTFCAPGSVTLSVSTCSNCTYQWRVNAGNIAGANSPSYTATTSGDYDCVVTNSCGSRTSNNIIVTTASMLPMASITAGGPATFCSPGSVTLNANTGTGLFYQWRLNNVNISGATSSAYAATATGNYDCIVTNACGSTTSNSIAVIVNSIPTATITAGGPTTFCSPGLVTLNANTGAGLSYQWRLNGGNISGATAASYVANASGSYDCVVSNTCGSTTSNSIAVTVNTVPSATITASGSTTFCSPGSVLLNANIGTGLSYQWRLNGGNISGATSSFYSATATGNYNCIVSNACGGITSNTISVTVNTTPAAIITAGGPTTFCTPGSVTLNANTASGLTYQWKLNGANISGATASSYTANATGVYNCVVTNSCGSTTSSPISITANILPATPGSITGQTTGVCASTKTYSINAVSGATSYTWTVPSGANISSGQGTTSVNVLYTSAYTSGNISVVATSSCGNSGASSATTTGVPAQPGNITGPASVCSNQNNVIYSITAVTGATSYTWTVPPGTQIKTGQGTVQIKVRFGNSAGNITVKANNACGSSALRTLAIAMPCRNEEEISESDFGAIAFPNPSQNDFTFVINAPENNSCAINIFDLTGRVIESHRNISSGNEFKCGERLTDGIYYAEIISGDSKKVLKLVKQR